MTISSGSINKPISTWRFIVLQLLLPFSVFSSSSETFDSKESIDEIVAYTWGLKYSQPDSFAWYNEQIISSSKHLNYAHGLAFGYTYKGVGHYLNDRYDSAQYFFDLAYPEFEKDNDLTGLARVYNYKGLCFDALDNYENALIEYNKSLELKQKLNDDLAVANTLNNIGTLYITQQQYDKALECLEKAQVIYLNNENTAGQALVLNNIGLVHDEQGDFELAIEYYLGSLKLEEKLNRDKSSLALSHNNIGSLYAEEKRYDEALYYYNIALKLFEKAESLSGIMLVRNNLSEAYRETKNTAQAITEAQIALSIADSIKAAEDLQLAHENLALTYKATADYKNALIHFEASAQIRDSLKNISYRAEIADAKTAFIMTKNYETIQEERFRIIRYGKEKTIQQVLLIIGVLSILVVFGVHGNWIKLNARIVDFLLVIGVMCLFEGFILLHNENFSGKEGLDPVYRYAGHFILFLLSVTFIFYGRNVAKEESDSMEES